MRTADKTLRHWPMATAFALMAVLTACGGGDYDINEPQPNPDLDFSLAAQKLDNAVGDHSIGGYSFVLVNGSGLLYSRSGGSAGGSAYTTTRALPIASASKALAAAAIMTLVDEGRLNLDVPVHQYLQGTGVNWPSDDGNQKARITMRMLLSHTSGLPGSNQDPACLDQANFSGGLAACVAVIASNQVPLVANPGTVFTYGGADFQVAGFVATVLAQADSWQDFFDQALAAPLHASSQMFYPAGSNPRVAGGAQCSAVAYAAFLQMLIKGGTTVLSPSSVTALHSNQLGSLNTFSGSGNYTPFGAAGPSYPQYGLGFFIEKSTLHPGSSGPEVSSPGLFGATPWADFDVGYGAMLLIFEDNSGSAVLPKSLELWNQLRTIILGELA